MAFDSQKLPYTPNKLDIYETVGLTSLQFLNEQELTRIQFNDIFSLEMEPGGCNKIEADNSETSSVCNKFLKKHVTQSHLKTYTKMFFACFHCEYKSTRKWTLQQHLRVHRNEKPFHCKLCDFKSKRYWSLVYHVKKHLGFVKTVSGKNAFLCNVCDYTARSKDILESHIANKHGGLNCPYCNYCAKIPASLKTHLRVHTKEYAYTCKICSYSTTTKGNFTSHMMVHSDEKPYSCKLCNYRTKWTTHLQAHMLTHTEEKHFMCQVCNKLLKTKNSLRIHNRIHAGVKPYICKVCGYSATNHYAVNGHMTTHLVENRFKCHKCEFACRTKRTIVKHVNHCHIV